MARPSNSLAKSASSGVISLNHSASPHGLASSRSFGYARVLRLAVEDHAGPRLALVDEHRRRQIDVHAVFVGDADAAGVAGGLVVVARAGLAADRVVERVEHHLRVGIPRDQERHDDVDVVFLAVAGARDRGADGHRALRVHQCDQPVEGTSRPVDPVAHHLEAVDRLVVVGLGELDPDGDVGQQDVDDLRQRRFRQIFGAEIHWILLVVPVPRLVPPAPRGRSGWSCYVSGAAAGTDSPPPAGMPGRIGVSDKFGCPKPRSRRHR